MKQDAPHEADVSAQKPQAKQQARLPGPHEDPRWAADPQQASEKGSEASDGQDRLEVGPSETAGDRGGSGFPRSSRIRKGNEIRSLLQRGKRTRTSHLDVFHAVAPVPHPRWGLIVPKHGRAIVERNKLKRRLREIGRIDILPELRKRSCPLDVLVRARREAYGASYHVLRDQLTEVTESLCSAPFSSV
jgi:ribonuclease P protein component